MYITNFLISLYKNIKYQRLLHEAYEHDELIAKLSYIMGSQFKIDWIGRIYAVINPNIRDGKYSPEQIFEFNEMGGVDTAEFMNKWIMSRLTLIRNFILAENLFELLTYDIKPLDEHSNYLFVIEPVTLANVFHYGKRALIEIGIIGAILLTYFLW